MERYATKAERYATNRERYATARGTLCHCWAAHDKLRLAFGACFKAPRADYFQPLQFLASRG